MGKFLFVNHASVGHLAVLLEMAVAVKAAGHSVRFMMMGAPAWLPRWQIFRTAAAIPELARAEGIPVELMRPPISLMLAAAQLPGKTGYAETRHALGLAARGLSPLASQLRSSMCRDRPDGLVADFAFLAGSVAADAEGVPYAAVFHSGLPFRGKGIPPFGSGLPIGSPPSSWRAYAEMEKRVGRKTDSRVNRARRQCGLPEMPGDIVRRPYSPYLNLIASVPEIEAPRHNLTAQTHFIGPCFGRRRPLTADFPFGQLREDCRKIYVSLGTVFNDKPEVFRTLARALDDARYQVILSAGGAYETLKRERLPDNVLLRLRVPQVELLPRVDLVIGHGGNNSTNETLAAGKPLLVLPIGGEQADNARRIEWLGVGRSLGIASLHEREVREAVESLLADPALPARSRRLQEAISRSGGAGAARSLLEAMIARA